MRPLLVTLLSLLAACGGAEPGCVSGSLRCDGGALMVCDAGAWLAHECAPDFCSESLADCGGAPACCSGVLTAGLPHD
jgi:hypothetical protein